LRVRVEGRGFRESWVFRVEGLGSMVVVAGCRLRIAGLGVRAEFHGMEGFNHCVSHCQLARFRDLMYGVKYGASIGWKFAFLHELSVRFQVMGCSQPITAPYFTLYIKSRHFARCDSVNDSGCPLPDLDLKTLSSVLGPFHNLNLKLSLNPTPFTLHPFHVSSNPKPS
jgi:hypothetical protein